jgi:murein L,D-transpeptidase YafK
MSARLVRSAPLAFALGAAALTAGCNGDGSARALQPLSSETLALFEQKGVTKNAPTLLRAYKKEAELEIWKQKSDGAYVYVKTFPMCRWSGQLGPKTREGDRQVPEGFYSITPGQMNPNSNYYLSFNVGYPNAYDRAHGYRGGLIMVHGACSSAGCFSMTDEQIAEIYAIARESFAGGQRSIQMQSMPFKMTADNLAKHRLDPNMPFWRQLKKGSDMFEVSKQEPAVGLCGSNYGFNLGADACAPQKDPEIASAVQDKESRDETKVAELIQKGVQPVRVVYADGGQHPSFRNASPHEVSRPDALAQEPVEIALADKKIVKPLAVAAMKRDAGLKLASRPTVAPDGLTGTGLDDDRIETKAVFKRAMSYHPHPAKADAAQAIDAAESLDAPAPPTRPKAR